MSSLIRRIQLGLKRQQRGSATKWGAKIGIPTNTNAKDYLARMAREAKREAIRFDNGIEKEKA